MNGRIISVRDGFEHKFFYLDDKEKSEMQGICKTWEPCEAYWRDKLVSKGAVVKSILRIQQLKDIAGAWMNVFKVNYNE